MSTLSSTRSIPPLLTPLLRLPPHSDSLILLTNVLGASTNWLLLRFLAALLPAPHSPRPRRPIPRPQDDLSSYPPSGNVGQEGPQFRESNVRVVFASFLRDWAFWVREGSRAGVDLEGARARGTVRFIDGLGLSLARPGQEQQGPPDPSSLCALLEKEISLVQAQRPAIDDSNDGSAGPSVILLLDGLDYLLASSAPSQDKSPALELMTALVALRRRVHTTILTLAADAPLLPYDSHHLSPPLGVAHSALVTWAAHQAAFCISLRTLHTGVARDVSGVLRITIGGQESIDGDGEQPERGGEGDTGGGEEGQVEEGEFLYFVGGDGGVRVFGRGE